MGCAVVNNSTIMQFDPKLTKLKPKTWPGVSLPNDPRKLKKIWVGKLQLAPVPDFSLCNLRSYYHLYTHNFSSRVRYAGTRRLNIDFTCERFNRSSINKISARFESTFKKVLSLWKITLAWRRRSLARNDPLSEPCPKMGWYEER